jgi:hypothetical protein
MSSQHSVQRETKTPRQFLLGDLAGLMFSEESR